MDSKQLESRARDFAARTVAALGNRQLVETFVDSYVKEFARQGLTNQAARRRELLETLTREALLAMFAQAMAELPAHLTRRKPAVLKGAEIRAAEDFAERAVEALARTLHWGTEDVEGFRGDLALYMQIGARQSSASGLAAKQGPFVDRAALLLDPSLMDKAQRAAAKFLEEIEGLAERSLEKALTATPMRRGKGK
jgi:hypothetical protein